MNKEKEARTLFLPRDYLNSAKLENLHAIECLKDVDGECKTPFLLGVWLVLLAKFSQQNDFSIGVSQEGQFNSFHFVIERYPNFCGLIEELDQWLQNPHKSADFHFSNIDLALQLTEKGCVIHYDPSLFDAGTMAHLAESLSALAVNAVKNLEEPLTTLEVLSSRQRDLVLQEWAKGPATINGYTELIYPQLFEEQVKQTPQKTAIIYGKNVLTYHQVNEKANQIAHFLRKNGIVPGKTVAVYASHSEMLPVTLLGVLKAGGIYVPVDASLPVDRIEYILEDSSAEFILGEKELLKKLTKLHAVPIDIYSEEIKSQLTRNLSPLAKKEDGAYVMYTSGSTGRPKGVFIEHRNLTNFLFSIQSQTPLNGLDRLLHLTSFGFDVSIFSLWLPLLEGASVVITPNNETGDVLAINRLLKDEHCTVLFVTPYIFKLLLAENELETFSDLRLIHVAGEALKEDTYFNAAKLKNCATYNCYGPTETTVYATIYKITEKTKGAIAPIGKPLPNYETYILTPELKPVPIGSPGELYIGGEGLAREYFNKPEITRERFIPHPFAENKGGRLYRTGDLTRWRSDGTIEFLGRIDSQVKLRGFRIELGEIEYNLLQHPSVNEAVVVLQAIGMENELIGYVTCKKPISEKNLKKHLRKILPSYMIPLHILTLKEMPVNVNGKIDRKSLPVPELRNYQSVYVAPRNELETTIAKIWEELLHIDRVGIHDNFFELGGHSLLVAQLAVRLQEELKRNFPLDLFFTYPTIETLTEVADTNIFLVDLANDVIGDIQRGSNLAPVAGNLAPSNNPKAILLTGATGFLGPQVLQKLLENTRCSIYCLLRDHNRAEGRERLRKHLLQSGFSFDENRIRIALGNIEDPLMGMDASTHKEVCEEVDQIFNLAANVHHLYDYASLREANVWSVVELLKVASCHHPKRIFHISTISASVVDPATGKISEDFTDTFPKGFELGYNISKWAAEKVLQLAMVQGFAITLFRPGQIIADEVPPSAFFQFFLLLKGVLQLGKAPLGLGVIPLIRAKDIATVVSTFSQQEENRGKIYNLVLPFQPTFDNIFHVLQQTGLKELELIPFNEWRDQILPTVDKSNAFWTFKTSYSRLTQEDLDAFAVEVETQKFQKELLRLGVELEPFNEQNAITYIRKHKDWFLGQ